MGPLAETLRAEAAALRERFDAAFWCADIATYALALDGAKRPCRVRTSNAGQVLLSGIASPRRAALVADGLMDRDFFSGWGIRTVAESEARYNPMSYHNGSVWPHDNALIALGLAHYGLSDHVVRLFRGMFDAASYMDLRRLPELFCGFRRRPGKGPTFYPVACSPQAWAAGAPFMFLETMLGLRPHAERGELELTQPNLPDWLGKVTLTNLRVGDAAVDLLFHRWRGTTSAEVLRKVGPIAITIRL
jgi:glycogen debranching enzyme